MPCTHKIKREERVWIFKTEKNGMEVIVFFCFKNPYPFHHHSTSKEHFRLVNYGHYGVDWKIKKNNELDLSDDAILDKETIIVNFYKELEWESKEQ